MDNPENETGGRRESESVKPDLMGLEFPTSDELMDPFAGGELPAAVEFPGIKVSSPAPKASPAGNQTAKVVAKGGDAKAAPQETLVVSPQEKAALSSAAKEKENVKGASTEGKKVGGGSEQDTVVLNPKDKAALAAAAKTGAKPAAEKTTDGKVKIAPATPTNKAAESTTAKKPPPASSIGASEESEESPHRQRRFMLLTATPAWLVSMLVHMLFVLALALMSFSEDLKATAILTVASNSDSDGKSEIEQFDIEDANLPVWKRQRRKKNPLLRSHRKWLRFSR